MVNYSLFVLKMQLNTDPLTNLRALYPKSCSACLRRCPRYLPFVLVRHLHPTHWSWWKSEASFCPPPGPMRAIYEDRIWQTQFPRCCTQNIELFTATSPFVNHQPTTVPVWAQNSSLQTHLYMTFTSENYW